MILICGYNIQYQDNIPTESNNDGRWTERNELVDKIKRDYNADQVDFTFEEWYIIDICLL